MINAASGAGTNYQVNITVYYTSGTDSAGSVYLAGKCDAYFRDIRFTDSTGNGNLSYWCESNTTYVSGFFWVKVSANLNTTAQTIYIYYNRTTSTTSNGVNTFLFFDDFDDGSLDTNKWQGDTASWTESAGTVSTSTTPKNLYSKTAFTMDGYAIRCRAKGTSQNYFILWGD